MSIPISDNPKYQGAGNDFFLIDDRPLVFPTEDFSLIQALCHRKEGKGADGVILLQPSKHADFRMRIFNSDGKEAESCGNGLRCLVRFLLDLKLIQKEYRIEIGGEIVKARPHGEKIEVDLGSPKKLLLNQTIGPWMVHSVDTGVPHAVIFVPDVEAIDLAKEAPLIRHHPLFAPRGTNVNFATRDKEATFRVRTFERGVEGETLACGTGAAAVAVIAQKVYGDTGAYTLHFKGGKLSLRIQAEKVTLIGPASRTF